MGKVLYLKCVDSEVSSESSSVDSLERTEVREKHGGESVRCLGQRSKDPIELTSVLSLLREAEKKLASMGGDCADAGALVKFCTEVVSELEATRKAKVSSLQGSSRPPENSRKIQLTSDTDTSEHRNKLVSLVSPTICETTSRTESSDVREVGNVFPFLRRSKSLEVATV